MAIKTKIKTVSTVVKLTPVAVQKIHQLQTPYFAKYYKELSKSDAINMLLEEIQQPSIDNVISLYILN